MRYLWFWAFWHWSVEGCRDGALLREPFHGIAGHWDEWFRHEATAAEHSAIEEIGKSEESQRQFITWLLRHWSRDAGLRAKRSDRIFVLGQLANVEPFRHWNVFERYRHGYRSRGVSAVVLAEHSTGEPGDVRAMDSLALLADSSSPAVVTEGFQAEGKELETPCMAARSALRGKGLWLFLALWIAGGRRPVAIWCKAALALGWCWVAGLICYLRFGPEPEQRLFALSLTLLGLWAVLAVSAVLVAGRQVFTARREGRAMCDELEDSQVRLRMDGGLTLKGASAGLAFCLNTILSIYRNRHATVRSSWLWDSVLGRLRAEAASWAATGAVTPDGNVRQVVLEPKILACLQNHEILHLLVPRQTGADAHTVEGLYGRILRVPVKEESVQAPTTALKLGFAADKRQLFVHRCWHVSQAFMALGNLGSRWQVCVNALALMVSTIMIFALPDFLTILFPPSPPLAFAGANSSPYQFFVSLATDRPECFSVLMESDFWANRRAAVMPSDGINMAPRAEILLHRVARKTMVSQDDGTVWIERKYRFLGREFLSGERVGRYSLSYLTRINHE